MKTTLAALAGLLALSGCAVVQDAYDGAATDQCENIIDARDRLDCIDTAERAASDRRAEKRD